MQKKYNVFFSCFILVIIMCTACVKPISSNTVNKSATERETNTTVNDEKITEATKENATEAETESSTEIETESSTEIETESSTEVETESSTEAETANLEENTSENVTQSTKPQIQDTIESTENTLDIIYVPPCDYEDEYEITTEAPTEAPTEPAPKIYTVNVNVYKEVNGVKSFVKTVTVKGEKNTLYEIPLALQEDTRCKIVDGADNITGVNIWEKGVYQIASIHDEYLCGYVEDGNLICEIRKNNEYDITYYYREAKVNVVLFDEDYNYRIMDTYTISGGLGDTFTVDMKYPDEPIYELYTVVGFSDVEGNADFLLSRDSYIKEYQEGDTIYYEQVSIPGTYVFNSTFFDLSIAEIEIQYFGYIYSKPVYDSIIKDGMSDYEKAKAIHDWIVSNCYYDFNGEYGYESYTPYGIFKNRYAVCDGYTYGFMHLAKWAGLECERYTTGNHSWNRVKVDGEWYNVDCTYSDEKGLFFLKSDAYLVEKGHQWGFVADGVCNSTKYDGV